MTIIKRDLTSVYDGANPIWYAETTDIDRAAKAAGYKYDTYDGYYCLIGPVPDCTCHRSEDGCYLHDDTNLFAAVSPVDPEGVRDGEVQWEIRYAPAIIEQGFAVD